MGDRVSLLKAAGIGAAIVIVICILLASVSSVGGGIYKFIALAIFVLCIVPITMGATSIAAAYNLTTNEPETMDYVMAGVGALGVLSMFGSFVSDVPLMREGFRPALDSVAASVAALLQTS